MRLRVSNPVERDFGMVPRILWETSLPFTAKGVAAYLFCLKDGAMPYVAEIEATLGIGRDARRKAFSVLEQAGVIRWVTERSACQRVTGKTLQLHPENLRGPENQTHGKNRGKPLRSPEIPAGGNSTHAGTGTDLCGDGKSGDTKRERKKERAANARGAVRADRRGVSAASDLSGLSSFLRSQIITGQTCIVNGSLILRGSPEMARLQDAMKEANRRFAYDLEFVR